jgi:hypothetical protein
VASKSVVDRIRFARETVKQWLRIRCVFGRAAAEQGVFDGGRVTGTVGGRAQVTVGRAHEVGV